MMNIDAVKKFRARLEDAIASNDIPSIQAIFQEYPGAAQWRDSSTWLHFAASYSGVEVIAYLIENGLSIACTTRGSDATPIAVAAGKGRLEVVEFFLGCGATLDVSKITANPLFSAIYGRSLDVCKVLLDAGIDSTVRYDGPQYPGKYLDALSFALERGEREIARLIALHQADGDTADAQRRLTEAWEVMKLNNPHDDGSPYLPAPMIDGSERLPS